MVKVEILNEDSILQQRAKIHKCKSHTKNKKASKVRVNLKLNKIHIRNNN